MLLYAGEASTDEAIMDALNKYMWILHAEKPAPNLCPICGAERHSRPCFETQQWLANEQCDNCTEIARREQHEAILQLESKRKLAELKAVRANIRQIMTTCGAPAKYEAEVLTPPMGELALVLDKILAGRSAIILGATGRGKTTFAYLAATQLVTAGVYTPAQVKFCYVPNLCDYIRKGIDDKSFDYRLEAACTYPMLVLDDLYKEQGTPNNANIISTILNRRYENRLQTLITSRFGSEDFAKRYNDDTVSRIRTMLIYRLEGTDRRKAEEW